MFCSPFQLRRKCFKLKVNKVEEIILNSCIWRKLESFFFQLKFILSLILNQDPLTFRFVHTDDQGKNCFNFDNWFVCPQKLLVIPGAVCEFFTLLERPFEILNSNNEVMFLATFNRRISKLVAFAIHLTLGFKKRGVRRRWRRRRRERRGNDGRCKPMSVCFTFFRCAYKVNSKGNKKPPSDDISILVGD